MKHKKTLSAVLSAVMFCTAMPTIPAIHAAEFSPGFGVPNWVPQTYEDACEFSNTYGSTYVDDDLIGIVTCHYKKDG